MRVSTGIEAALPRVSRTSPAPAAPPTPAPMPAPLPPPAIPPMAVTLGMRDILASRKIRLYLAAGERHRAIFGIAVAGEVSTDYPVTLVQGHPDAEICINEAAAQPIEVRLR